eukprot:TRINITY_DN42252_c0_g1_i1.p1 TRINITY_DN42252_c0_g1~~TRINITY_DN42252_c0_g1_i1.p1  ORF type:complete len:578 (-),score=97.31 TRINITY_DN42252_c0_g1_i1:98-1831(-)
MSALIDSIGKGGGLLLFHDLLDSIEELAFVASMKKFGGVKFWFPPTQKNVTFEYSKWESEIQDCDQWAISQSASGALKDVGKDRLAAIRAYTGSASYVLNSCLRAPDRTLISIQPALSFMKLLIAGLHRLPPEFRYIGKLYRAEVGVRTTWDEKIRTGNVVDLFTPMSFTTDPRVLKEFFVEKGGPRTLFELEGGCGYCLSALSSFAHEEEVLVEPVARFRVFEAQKFDANHVLVLSGQVQEGLHLVRGVQIQGDEVLQGSPFREILQANPIQEGAAQEATAVSGLCRCLSWWRSRKSQTNAGIVKAEDEVSAQKEAGEKVEAEADSKIAAQERVKAEAEALAEALIERESEAKIKAETREKIKAEANAEDEAEIKVEAETESRVKQYSEEVKSEVEELATREAEEKVRSEVEALATQEAKGKAKAEADALQEILTLVKEQHGLSEVPSWINLRSKAVTDRAVMAVAQHYTGLQDIDLWGTAVTDAAVQTIAQHCAGLRVIYLGKTKVTDVAVQAIAQHCKGLQVIYLDETKVTDASVNAIAQHCTGLQMIHLYGTEITDEAVKVLRKEFPLADVYR